MTYTRDDGMEVIDSSDRSYYLRVHYGAVLLHDHTELSALLS